MTAKLTYLKAGEGRCFHVLGGDEITIKATGDDTGGAMTVVETIVRPGSGPPPHRHLREDEVFYVIEGEFEFNVGGRVIAASPGDFLVAPRGIAHVFRNTTDAPGRLLITCHPAGFEKFVEAFAQVPTDQPPDPAKMAEFNERFGIEFVATVDGSGLND